MMDSIQTPDLTHFTLSDYDNVYEPAEDSFLMLDALECELETIRKQRPLVCVEVGSGSGVVLTGLAKSLGQSCMYLSTDLNPHAATATQKTAVKNSVIINVVNCDLVVPLIPRLWNSVDVLIFNPPYVPTEECELSDNNHLALSWAGGLRGRAVMDRFFPHISDIMSQSGIFYLLIVRENDENDILSLMRTKGWAGYTVKERRAGPEFLKVLKFHRLSEAA